MTHLRSGASFSGVVSEVNSLVGTRLGDSVGSAVTVLANGNYVICSPTWSASDTLLKVGAATWVDKNAPRTGALAAADSLTGAQAGDQVCDGGVVALNGNSNYVVSSGRFKSGAVMVGAATWGDGASGRKGVVSATNSLLGTGGSTTAPMPIKVTPLRGNGNYVVALAGSTRASGVIGDSMGAAPVVWADGRFGITGIVPAAASSYVSNSGTFFDTQVVPLSNGNYVVGRPQWDNARGAVHWGEGIGGAAVGLLTEATALTGSSAGDSVGVGAIVALTNGNYVVISPEWRGQQGAVTWMNGTAPATGSVSEANSLVGPAAGSRAGSGGVAALANGNYFVSSPSWDTPTNRGGWTWGDGASGSFGALAAANTVTGGTAGDALGTGATLPLAGGSVVALARQYDVAGAADAGTACEYSGTAAISGGPTPAYCVMGSMSGAGSFWTMAASPKGDFWAVLRPQEKVLTIVGAPDLIMRDGFEP